MHAMHFGKPLLLLAALLLPGCAELDTAKEQVSEAQDRLETARGELDALRARLERMRTLTAIRQEVLDVAVAPRLDADGLLRFEINATRDGVAIPAANVTRVAPIAVRADGGAWVLCEPVTCAVPVAEGARVEVRAAPEDGTGCVVTRDVAPACSVELSDATAWVTTSVGDATS